MRNNMASQPWGRLIITLSFWIIKIAGVYFLTNCKYDFCNNLGLLLKCCRRQSDIAIWCTFISYLCDVTTCMAGVIIDEFHVVKNILQIADMISIINLLLKCFRHAVISCTFISYSRDDIYHGLDWVIVHEFQS